MFRGVKKGIGVLNVVGGAVCATGVTHSRSLLQGSALYSDALAGELQAFQILVVISAVSRHALTKSKMRAVKYKSRPLTTQSSVVCAYTLNRLYN